MRACAARMPWRAASSEGFFSRTARTNASRSSTAACTARSDAPAKHPASDGRDVPDGPGRAREASEMGGVWVVDAQATTATANMMLANENGTDDIRTPWLAEAARHRAKQRQAR